MLEIYAPRIRSVSVSQNTFLTFFQVHSHRPNIAHREKFISTYSLIFVVFIEADTYTMVVYNLYSAYLIIYKYVLD